MKWFLIFFLIIYSSLHAYFYVKMTSAFYIKLIDKIILILFLIFTIVSPILIRVIERKGFISIAKILAYTGYLWMSFIFLFICISLFIDIIKGGEKTINYILGKNIILFFTKPMPAFLISISLSLIIIIYGLYEANNIRLKKVVIQNNKLVNLVNELRIVQISDLHISLTVNKSKLEKIASLIKEAKPDILFCTGDMIDADTQNLNELSAIFRSIEAKYGKYAITGNHEYYFGLKEAKKFLENSGFILIQQKVINVNNFLTIIGIDDPTAKYDLFKTGSYLTEKELLPKVTKNSFIILLKHRPTVEKEAINHFDLQLSGHTHKGQIFPFALLTRIFFPLVGNSLHKFGNSYIYVSAGTGTWGPPIRFLAPPEVTLIIIHN